MSQSPAQEFFRKGIAFAQAGDLVSAESNLKQCIALEPSNATAMLNLGIVLMNRGDYSASEQILFQSVNTQASVENISTLAKVLEVNGKSGKAEECYRIILTAMPDHPPTLMKLAELADQEGDWKKARDLYKSAWDAEPENLSAAIAYATNAFKDDPAEPASVMERLLQLFKNDPVSGTKVLQSLLPYKEFHERMKRGLMPYHGTGLNELFFTYARDDAELFRKLSLSAPETSGEITPNIRKFTGAFVHRDFSAAQQYLEQIIPHTKDHVWENVSFDPRFYAELNEHTDEEIFGRLPPLSQVNSPDFSSEPIIFLSCSHAYFTEFGLPLIHSLADRGPGSQVHLHIIDADPVQLGKIAAFCREKENLKIALTAENPDFQKQGGKAARSYYHAIRFIRFYQLLKRYPNTLWMMDVDALFNRNPREMFDILTGNDVALRIRPGRLEPWNQFSACIVGAKRTSATLKYFKLIAAYIFEFYRRDSLRWGIDQLAMFGVYEYLRAANQAPALSFVDARIADLEYEETGVVWLTAGKAKFLAPHISANIQVSAEDARREKYDQLFRKFSRP